MVRPLYAIFGALVILLVWLGLVLYEANGDTAATAISLADSAARASLPGLAARGYLLAADVERQRLGSSGIARDSAAGQALIRRIIDTRMAAARLLLQKGYVEAAEAIALQGAQADFDDIQARALLLEVRLRGDHPEEARRELMLRLVREQPPQLLYLLGNSFARENKQDDAAACFERALKLAPDHAPSLLALAQIRAREGQQTAAMALENQAQQAAATRDKPTAMEVANEPVAHTLSAADLGVSHWCSRRWPSLALAGVYLLFLISPSLLSLGRGIRS